MNNPDFVPRHRHLDKQNHWVLDDEYLLAFHHLDGFTARLLAVDLLLNKNFQLSVYHRCFQLGHHPPRPDDHAYSFRLEVAELPPRLYSFLEKVVDTDLAGLKSVYSDPALVVCDSSSQQYLFNTRAGTKAVAVDGFIPLTRGFFSTGLEQEFLAFHQFIRQWTEDLYDHYVQAYSPSPPPAPGRHNRRQT